MDPVQKFYDGWAEEYHLIFEDWKQSVDRQARVLDALIQKRYGAKPQALLDCTCGIGTQSIGLATRGYNVTASDLSPKAVERAIQEAKNFGVALNAKVADLRSLDEVISEEFDVVISCDNSLCHLLENRDLQMAVNQMKGRLRSGGLFLATIRDYDAIRNPAVTSQAKIQDLPGDFKKTGLELPTATMPKVFHDDKGRRIAFQIWDWTPDGTSYAVNQFTLTAAEDTWQTTFRVSRFRALLRSELSEVLKAAGFRDIHWHMPEETEFYQPIVTARA